MKTIYLSARKGIAVLVAFALFFTMMPALTGDLTVHAASVWKSVKASAIGETQASISWKALTKKQRRKISGIAVFRDGELVTYISKNAKSYTDSGLKAGTTYSYQLKTYKKKIKTSRMWYNKATGEYQKKKPARKYRGKRKTFRTETIIYYVAAEPVEITTGKASSPTDDTQGESDETVDTSLSDGDAGQTAVNNIRTAQSIYSVSTEIKSFNLNASGAGPLSYKSSDSTVASVSETGIVNVKKNGTARITVSDGMSSKDVTVKVAAYKAANGNFIEGMGNLDKKPGDSSGKEIRVKKYPGYKATDHSRSWGFIVRCTDPEIADKAALAVSYIANNNNFGFESLMHTSQAEVSKRASIYNAVVKATGKKPSTEKLKVISSITQKADTSCTPTCLSGYWLYYDAFSDRMPMKWIPPYDTEEFKYNCGAVNVEYHQLEEAIKHVNNEYKKRGMIEPFTIIYISSDGRSSFFSKSNIKKNLKRGDIICSCPDPSKGGHTGLMM